MRCSDKNIGKHLSGYIEKTISGALRRDFEVHLFECQYCWGKVQQADKDEEIDTLIRTYGKEAFQEVLREINERGDKKLPLKKEMPQEDEQHFTQEPVQEQIPTLWLMLNNAIMKEIKFRPGIPWTTELSKPGVYSVINQEKQILYQMRKLPDAEKGVSPRGKADSISRPKMEVIEIPIRGKQVNGELAIKLERKKEKLLLSLSVKVLKR